MDKINRKYGFSLIELMAVVTIIALLFAFAIPSYQRYMARSQVARVVLEAGNLKTVVENCMNDGIFTIGKASEGFCDTNSTASSIIIGDSQGDLNNAPNMGVPKATIVEATNTATIEAIFGHSALAIINGDFIRWSRDASGTWECESTAEDKYNPPGCL